MGDILKRFNMEECKPQATPLATKTRLVRSTSQALEEERLKYHSMVGSLMYLMVATRPDLAFAVGAVSQFMSNPAEEHHALVKRLLRYVQGTRNVGLELGGELQLTSFCDADWASNEETRKSTTGYIFKVGVGTVSWASKRQPTVALSTTEA
jgi:hypothetical protein